MKHKSLLTNRGRWFGFALSATLVIPALRYEPVYPSFNMYDALHTWPWIIAAGIAAAYIEGWYFDSQERLAEIRSDRVLRSRQCTLCGFRNLGPLACRYNDTHCIECCNCDSARSSK